MTPIEQDVRRGLVSRLLDGLGLRHPVLFLLFAALFVADLLVPDFVPLADEIGLALITALLGSWRARRDAPPEAR